MKHAYVNYLTGFMPLDAFFAALTFCLLAAAGYKLFQARRRYKPHGRIPADMRTPLTFSWKFWWADNCVEVAWTLLCSLLAVRFAPDIISLFAPQWVEFFKTADNMFIYVVVGVGISYSNAKMFKNMKK